MSDAMHMNAKCVVLHDDQILVENDDWLVEWHFQRALRPNQANRLSLTAPDQDELVVSRYP